MNNCCFMGRITKDIELKATTGGTPVLRFTIAVKKRVKDKSSSYDADFIDCLAWRSKAEFISKYFRKGDMIAVSGFLSTELYTDKNNVKRKNMYVTIDEAHFCGGKSESNNLNVSVAPSFNSASSSDFEEIEESDDELPF